MQRCAVDVQRRPDTQMLSDLCCPLLLPDTCWFDIDVQLLNPVFHSPGHVSRLMAV